MEELFDILALVDARSGAGTSSDVDSNLQRMRKIKWAEDFKRILFIDNIPHYSGTLFQEWLLRTINKIEDMRLEFLQRDQTNRIVEERELQLAVL